MTIEHISFCRYDIIIGGSFIRLSDALYHTASIPYDYDDIIWCIQRSKIVPKYLSILNILPPELWFAMFFIGVVFVGIMTYFIVQFDKGLSRRNQLDMNYMLFIHPISTFFSNPHNFKPKKTTFRMMLGHRLIMAIIFQGFVGVTVYRCMKIDIFYHQITTSHEMVDSNFRLAGSSEVLQMIKQTGMVS